MKHTRKIQRAQGVVEIRSQLEEMRQIAMFEKMAQLGSRPSRYRKDREFTFWYESLAWNDDIKQQERAYEDWMLANVQDIYEDIDQYDTRLLSQMDYLDYDRDYEEYARQIDDLDMFSRTNWHAHDLDSIRRGDHDFDLMIRCRRLHCMRGNRPSEDRCSSSWKADWLLGYVDDEYEWNGEYSRSALDDDDDWMDGFEECHYAVHEWVRCETLGLAENRHFERAQVRRRIHRSHPLRGRRAA